MLKIKRSTGLWITSFVIVLTLFFGFFSKQFVALAQFSAPKIQTPDCVTDGLTQGVIGYRLVGNTFYYVRRLATVPDGSVDDFGVNAGGDALEFFCLTDTPQTSLGKSAVCLSGENCPWR
ncbi:hypothetical protein [Nostoc favosum]|uniref:Uncharacterized protein n=1 Tax=Nostoc favosum CHAB5714 TaxID=2780399 RepID=A0ABS8I1V5_9NOSO|nr:hypothetical protein [Nostoc favosum]MCC5598197.1 hypothetical protein [Nostoc favosum CHAB5714]